MHLVSVRGSVILDLVIEENCENYIRTLWIDNNHNTSDFLAVYEVKLNFVVIFLSFQHICIVLI